MALKCMLRRLFTPALVGFFPGNGAVLTIARLLVYTAIAGLVGGRARCARSSVSVSVDSVVLSIVCTMMMDARRARYVCLRALICDHLADRMAVVCLVQPQSATD